MKIVLTAFLALLVLQAPAAWAATSSQFDSSSIDRNLVNSPTGAPFGDQSPDIRSRQIL